MARVTFRVTNSKGETLTRKRPKGPRSSPRPAAIPKGRRGGGRR